jgi:pimeloyl-ACP methyl ester carboxylesterase
VIVLHGDLSDGGPADYHRGFAAALARDVPGVVAVAMIRPGYADSEGRRSSGDNNGRRDHYTAPTIDALAGVTRRLAAHVGAVRTILVGHSGGAATAGVMIGRHPGLAQGAVLVACPCDIGAWRRDRGRPAWDRSLSPQDWAARVPSETTVLALTGEKDDNTRPFLAARYVDTLARRGVVARFQEIAGASHNSAFRDPAVVAASRSLVARQ